MALCCPECGANIFPDQVIHWGGWCLDEGRNLFGPDVPGFEDTAIHVSRQWGSILSTLMRAKGRTIPLERLADIRDAARKDASNVRDIYTAICVMRNQLKAVNAYVETIWCCGWRLLPRGVQLTSIPKYRGRFITKRK